MSAYRFIEDLSAPNYPAEVVEDEDGARILRVSAPVIPDLIWSRAVTAGVAMVLIGDDTVISADDYSVGGNEFPITLSSEPSYRDFLEHQKSQAEIDPLDTSQFVHLHTHTEMSALDGLSMVEEIINTVKKDPYGGGAVGSADHGNCAVHPELQEMADKYGIKAIFGMEAYFVPDRFRRSESWLELDGVRVAPEHLSETEKKKAEKKNDSAQVKSEYTHLTLWAEDNVGLRNLWAMSTEAYRDGLYDGKPRLDWDTLERHREGIICGTGCLRGPVSRPLIEEEGHQPDEDLARQNLLRLHAIFGDRLFIEIHTNQLNTQIKVNEYLERFSLDYKIPPLAAVDSHYSIPEHKIVHKTWLAMQTGKTLIEDTTLFSGDQDYHLKTAGEVRDCLDYLSDVFVEDAMTNTVKIARMCTARVGGEVTAPTYSRPSKEHPDPVHRDIERLTEICLDNWSKVVGKRSNAQVYMDRFEREMALLISKQFCGYFMIVWDYVKWAKDHGCLVGPGRGSGCSSLVAYLADIVETDPVDADLLFERFLTEGRTSLPDFDIDFPASWRTRILNYLRQRWGDDYVSNIGTVSRLRSKQAINDVVRVMTPVLPYEIPYKTVEGLKKAIEEADAPLAGKHLPWDEFCAQYASMVDPLIAAYPEIFHVVDVVMNRTRQYGKHAAGVVISTAGPLTDLPMRLAVDSKTKTEVMVTQFDMNALEILGYVKFDILTLRTLDTLQVCVDLIDEKFGVRINPYLWKQEYDDPQVWDEICSGKTLGIFQIETTSGTRLTKRLAPQSVLDLAAVMTVVRPGPMRSGLTESYLRRRAGIEPVTYADPRLESILGGTYGCTIYQEEILAIFSGLAGYNSTEADVVRKLLGKKQVEKVVAAGEEFVRRAVECETDPAVAEALWVQLAEFARYGFAKSHAFGYAMIGAWCGWFRFHFPEQFLVAALSTVDADRIPDFIQDCRNNGYGVIPPDINRSQVSFTAEGTDVIYGLSDVKGLGVNSAAQIVKMAPYSSLDDFIKRCVKFSGSEVNMGHVSTLVRVGAFDSVVSNRRAVEMQLEAEASGAAKRCVFTTEAPNPNHPFNVACSYDWPNEPDPPLLPRGRGKAKTYVSKPPPKKCTVACRQYSPPEPIKAEDVTPYNSEEIMKRERELLGVWITHSPFSMIPQEELDRVLTARMLEDAPMSTEPYLVIGIIEEVKSKVDINGGEYAFIKMNAQDGEVEAICFASTWSDPKAQNRVAKDQIVASLVAKNPRGYQIQGFSVLN